MSKADLLTLATQIEQATEDQQREMLIEAMKVLKPQWWTLNKPVEEIIDYTRWCTMLDAKAYESAAMMLVPEGLHWCCQTDRDGAHVSVGKSDSDARGTFYTDCHHGDAKALALALAAACCRAVAQEREARDA